jgi:DNA-binding transcriptional LysR family regulator
MRTIDPELFRTLVAFEETGSLAKAAGRVGRTESAASLQMKRLAELMGRPIFERSGRRLTLTNDGFTALLYARRILAMNDELVGLARKGNAAGRLRIASSQDFGETVLASVLRDMRRRFPQVKVEVQVEGGVHGLEALDKGEVDLVLTIGLADHHSARRLQRVGVEWIAAADFSLDSGAPVPLIVFNQPCRFKQYAIDTLNAAGRPWEIVFSSPSLSGLWAAAKAGLGVTVRSSYWFPPGLGAVEPGRFDLPDLGSTDLTIHYFENALTPELLEVVRFVERAILLLPAEAAE